MVLLFSGLWKAVMPAFVVMLVAPAVMEIMVKIAQCRVDCRQRQRAPQPMALHSLWTWRGESNQAVPHLCERQLHGVPRRGFFGFGACAMLPLGGPKPIQYQVPRGHDIDVCQAGFDASERTAVECKDGTARACDACQRGHTAADAADAGHLGCTAAVEPDRKGVGKLRDAGAAGAGIDQRQAAGVEWDMVTVKGSRCQTATAASCAAWRASRLKPRLARSARMNSTTAVGSFSGRHGNLESVGASVASAMMDGSRG